MKDREYLFVHSDGLTRATGQDIVNVFQDRIVENSQRARAGQEIYQKIFAPLAQWVDEHHDKVDKGIITTKDGGFLFIAAQKETQNDETLESSLYDLKCRIYDEFSEVHLSTLTLPMEATATIQSFLSSVNFVHAPAFIQRPKRRKQNNDILAD